MTDPARTYSSLSERHRGDFVSGRSPGAVAKNQREVGEIVSTTLATLSSLGLDARVERVIEHRTRVVLYVAVGEEGVDGPHNGGSGAGDVFVSEATLGAVQSALRGKAEATIGVDRWYGSSRILITARLGEPSIFDEVPLACRRLFQASAMFGLAVCGASVVLALERAAQQSGAWLDSVRVGSF